MPFVGQPYHKNNSSSSSSLSSISWYGDTKPFFVNENVIKVNKKNYCKHLKKQLFPAIKKLVKRDDWIFVQDSAPSYRSNLVKIL